MAGGLGDAGSVAAVDIYGTNGALMAAAPMTQARARAACVTLAGDPHATGRIVCRYKRNQLIRGKEGDVVGKRRRKPSGDGASDRYDR